MKVSVPHIPRSILNATSTYSNVINLEHAVQRVAAFLSPGNAAILTGAGVSVDSGIRAYRGEDGRYMNPNYRCVFFEFVWSYSLILYGNLCRPIFVSRTLINCLIKHVSHNETSIMNWSRTAPKGVISGAYATSSAQLFLCSNVPVIDNVIGTLQIAISATETCH